MKKVIQYILMGIFAVSLSGLITYFVANPSSFNLIKQYKFYVVTSGSMEPSIKVGSAILVAPQITYSPKDVITFMPNGSKKTVVTHRIKSEELLGGKAVYKTAGDANKDLDNWQIKPENILGKVILSVPYIGYLINFAKQPNGFILLVIVPATIVIYEELKSLFNETKKLTSKSFKKKKEEVYELEINLLPEVEKKKSISVAFFIMPIVGLLLGFGVFSGAQLLDKEKSIGNVFTAAANFNQRPLVNPNVSEVSNINVKKPIEATESAQN